MPHEFKFHSVSHDKPKITRTDIGKDTRYGLYLLRSEFQKDLFRIGATGVHNKGSMRYRLFVTYQTARREANWTTRNLKWTPLWAAEVVNGTQFSTVAAEYVIFSHFARHFAFVDHSGFRATFGESESIIGRARALEVEIREIVAFQIASTKA